MVCLWSNGMESRKLREEILNLALICLVFNQINDSFVVSKPNGMVLRAFVLFVVTK